MGTEALDIRSTQILSILFSIVVASIYTFVGSRLAKRQVSPESKLAAQMFSVWWYGLAAITIVGSVNVLMVISGRLDLAAAVTVTHVALITLCVALAGLLYYLAFLFTGKRSVLVPIVVFYTIYYIYLVAWVTYSGPNGLSSTRWGAQLSYEHATTRGPAYVILLLMTLLPVLIGAIAYFSLYFRVRDRSQKYRIALVAGTITVWFSTSLLASFARISTSDTWQLASRFIGAAAALLILWAYDPPRWVQRKLGVRSVVNGPEKANGPRT